MSKIANKDATAQGPGGQGGMTKSNGSHLDQSSAFGAKRGSNGSHYEQGVGGAKAPKANGSHLEPGPNLPSSKKTAVRGGGTKAGHSKDPAAKRSGSKKDQHPNVKR